MANPLFVNRQYANGSVDGTKLAVPLTLGGNLTISPGRLAIGSANEYIRNPANNTANISLESSDGYAFVCGKIGANVAGNAYWDGSGWQRYDTSASAAVFYPFSGNFTFAYGAAGANPLTTTAALTIAGSTGNLTSPANANWNIGGEVAFGDIGSGNAFIDATAQHQFRSAGGAIRATIDSSRNMNVLGDITVGGCFRHTYTVITTNGTTMSTWSTFYIVNTPGITVYLPAGGGRAGCYVIVKNWAGSPFTLACSGGQVLGMPDGSSPASISVASGQSYVIMSDGGAGMMVVARAI